MTAVALKEKAMHYITTFDDDQLRLVVNYMETLPKQEALQNSKTPEERERAQQAFDNILAMSFTGSTSISKDGSKEVAGAVSGEKAAIEDNEISYRLSLLSGLQKYRGRLGDDFDAEKELSEARSLKYGK
jgi:predicted dienelactone hydrolase